MRPAPSGVDVTVPSVARIYDCFLDGKDNFEVDRTAAGELLSRYPRCRDTCVEQREFLIRAVTWLVTEAGIRQFLDIGSGLPTRSNVHDVVRGHAPGAHVVYADYDPQVVTHAMVLLADSPEVGAIRADLREPETILRHPDVQRLIDFTQPAAVLLTGIVHFIRDEEQPAQIIGTLRDAIAPGSYLVLSHVTSDNVPAEISEGAQKIYARTSAPIVPRSHDAILPFFDGLELVGPGLVNTLDWPRALPRIGEPSGTVLYGGVGRKP